jgi:hypothetical protein
MESFDVPPMPVFLDAPAERERAGPSHFEIVPGAPPDAFQRTPSGWLWYIQVKQYTRGTIALVNGEGLTVSSNNPVVVPNDDLVFKGKTGSERYRVIEFYTLNHGTALLDVRDARGTVAFVLQVHVSPVSGRVASFIALKAPQQALNASNTPIPYHMVYTATIRRGEKAADIIAKVHSGVNHLAISCHSSSPGVLEIGENIDKDNVAAFADLRTNTGARVIWIGACAVAGSTQGLALCSEMAKRSGCYVVAPGILAPPVKAPVGSIEFWDHLLPHYFSPKGEAMPADQYLLLGNDLGFTIEGRY